MAAVRKYPDFRLMFVALLLAAALLQDATGTRVHMMLHNQPTESSLQNSPKRVLIGSVAPTCTYNECRGCKYKCRADQVPVEGNDPINSPYHYKCVCHR